MAQRKEVASRVTIHYSDGTDTAVRIGVREIVEMERRWPMGILPAFESTLYGAWWALGKPGDHAGRNGGDPDEAFNRWIDSIDSIEDEEVEVTPTVPAVGDD